MTNLAGVSGTSSARRIPCVLSIAGSDSGGGAGIQADLKAFAACGVHGMTAITAITAQNTVGVTGVQAIEPEMILAQVRAVAQDIGVDAVKLGMLGSVATIEAVAQALDELGEQPGGRVPVVLDPVMVAESGAELLAAEARGALVELLLPRATVVTPNVPEARALVGGDAGGEPDAVALARAVHALGPRSSSSPAGTAPRRSTCSSTVARWSRSPASGTRTGPLTARDARTPRCWRRGWPGAIHRCRRHAPPSGGLRRPSGTG